MSGRVPPGSRANSRRVSAALSRSPADVKRAALLRERFTGEDTIPLDVVNVPPLPAVVAVIGECDGVLYTTVRDGRTESYIHEFASKDKPLLCVDPSGRQILLIGGRYVFTNRGIVDLSDTKNLPAKYRELARRLSR